ncbi:MAG: hypothetical protein ACPGQL_10935 [Thermoplasmatota archaeon]
MPLSPRPAKATAFTLGAACVVLWFTLTDALWGTDWFWHPGWDGVALVAALPAGAALTLGIRWLAGAHPTGHHGSWAFAGVVVVLLAAGAVFFGVVINQEWGHCGLTPEGASWVDEDLFDRLEGWPQAPDRGWVVDDHLPDQWRLRSVQWSPPTNHHNPTLRVSDNGMVHAQWLDGTNETQIHQQLTEFLGLLGRAEPSKDATEVLSRPSTEGRVPGDPPPPTTWGHAHARLPGAWNFTGIVPRSDDAWDRSGIVGTFWAQNEGLRLSASAPTKSLHAYDLVLIVDERGQAHAHARWGEMSEEDWLVRAQSALAEWDIGIPSDAEVDASIC